MPRGDLSVNLPHRLIIEVPRALIGGKVAICEPGKVRRLRIPIFEKLFVFRQIVSDFNSKV